MWFETFIFNFYKQSSKYSDVYMKTFKKKSK